MARKVSGLVGREPRAPRRAPRPPPGGPQATLGGRTIRRRAHQVIDRRPRRQEEPTMSETKIEAPAGVPFIDVSREFDAPRDLVFRAYTDPELIVQWLG